MIDYATWCAIRDGVARHLTPAQLAGDLGLDVKTVRHWINRPYTPRVRVQRTSKLDPFKGRIVGWLDAHPLTAQQVFQRLGEAGYEGGISIVKDYVRSRADFPPLAGQWHAVPGHQCAAAVGARLWRVVTGIRRG